MRLNDWQNRVNVRERTDSALIGAFRETAEAIGCMMAEGRSLRFNGIENLEQALNHITQAEKELREMRALEDKGEC
jgi:hypothetical protein